MGKKWRGAMLKGYFRDAGDGLFLDVVGGHMDAFFSRPLTNLYTLILDVFHVILHLNKKLNYKNWR